MLGNLRVTNGNVIIVVDANQVAELQMASSASSFTGNTFHGTAIAKEAIGVVVDYLEAGLVEDGSSVSLTNGKSNGIRETLTQGASGNFNTRGVMGFWMARGDATHLLSKYVNEASLEIQLLRQGQHQRESSLYHPC